MAVAKFSKAADGKKKFAPNFTVGEFACKDGSDTILIDTQLAWLLQSVRDHFGRPVRINSGYRTKAYNALVGGASESQHVLGTAADILVEGYTPKEVAAYVETLMPAWGGIGTYKTFTHVDVRPNKARWNG